MKPEGHEEVRWVSWLLAVVLAPLACNILIAPFPGALRAKGQFGTLLGLMMGLWILSIAMVSVDHSRAIVRQKGMRGFLPLLLVWQGFTVAGIVASTAIWYGTCAIFTKL